MKKPVDGGFTLQLSTDLTSALKELKAAMQQLKARWQLSDRDHFQLRMLLDELVTNTISHGFASGIGSYIEIEIGLSVDRVCSIVYADDGPQFDSVSKDVQEGLAGTEKMGFGGVGLSLVKQMVDQIEYRYEDGRNIIELAKQVKNIL